MSLLKKYFQRSLFVNVKTSPVAKKVFQPAAAAAAGAAALWAAAFQQAEHGDSFLVKMGLTPFSILTLGVVAYIIKDRIKDWGRHFLVGKVERVLPDIERVLVYDSHGAKPCDLGRIRETIKKISLHKLPLEIHDLRYSGKNSALEAEIGEDIIHYNKKILLNKMTGFSLGGNRPDVRWGLREIIRINLRNYLQNLDDPFKEITLMDDEGNVSKAETHKIYNAHLALQISHSTKDGKIEREARVFKLVLDKGGLVKIQCFDDNQIPDALLFTNMLKLSENVAP